MNPRVRIQEGGRRLASLLAVGLRRLVAQPDLAIDLGTANTRLYAHGQGVVADEPSVLVSSTTPVVFPVRAGVVVDVRAAAELLSPLVRRTRRRGVLRPRALVCTPSDASAVERDALIEATRLAGAAVIAVAPEPLAGALGAGLNLGSPYARMLVDVGGGVTDIAVIRAGRIVSSAALRTACSDLERAVAEHVATRHGLRLDRGEAARLLREAGVHAKAGNEVLLTAKATRHPGDEISIRLTQREIHRATDPIMDRIVGKIAEVLRGLPNPLACQVIEDGICLSGGGACLPGIVERIESGTKLDVTVAPDPLHAVIEGAARLLGTIDQVRGNPPRAWVWR